MDKLVMSDGGKLYWVKFTRLFRIHPLKERVHKDVNFLGLRWNVISNINLRPPKYASFNWIHMTQYPFVNLQNVLQTDVVIPKN